MKRFKRALEHAERLRAKRERLEGLQALYDTYEQTGTVGRDMNRLRERIRRGTVQLQTMGEGIGPDEAGRE